MFSHGRRRQGAGGTAALPTVEKFAKIGHNWAENRPKFGQNFRKQWIFYRVVPQNSISPCPFFHIVFGTKVFVRCSEVSVV